MRVSWRGIDLITHFEGLRIFSYQDIAGIWSIGYGHTGPDVGPGQQITREKAEALLREDLLKFEAGVSRLVKVSIAQSQFDALVSFAYNIGLGAFSRSTALRLLNKGDYFGAAEAMSWWHKATINGVKREVMGLVRRRAAEVALFVKNLKDPAGEHGMSRVPAEESSPLLRRLASLAARRKRLRKLLL